MKIFLSYAREDEARVIPIFEALKNAGHSPWMDARSLIGGLDWQDEIEREIKRSDMFLMFLSRFSVNKRGVIQREIKTALKKAEEFLPGDIFVVPIMLEKCDVPDVLAKWHWIDTQKSDWRSALAQAIEKVELQRIGSKIFRFDNRGLTPLEPRSELQQKLQSKWWRSKPDVPYAIDLKQPVQFYSCFISYSSKDQSFADRLCADLQNNGVRCWFAPHDMPIGGKILDEIDSAIRLTDKVLLILSEHSIQSDWVEDEISMAFEEERKRGQVVLFPIRLDDAVMGASEAWATKLRATRHIGDFRRWKEHDTYNTGFERIVRELQTEYDSKIKPKSQSKWWRSKRGMLDAINHFGPWTILAILSAAIAIAAIVLLSATNASEWLKWSTRNDQRHSCSDDVTLECIQRGEVVGKVFASVSNLSCRKELSYRSNEATLNWKNVWTTSVYSFAPGGGGPGGGLEDDVLKVGGWGDWYYSLIQFDVSSGPFAFGVPKFVGLLLYAKTDQLGPVGMLLERIAAPWGGHDTDRLWWKDQPTVATGEDGPLPAPKQANWYVVDITSLYQDWLRKKFPNYGLRLRPTSNAGTVNFFVSSLAADSSKIPRLIACW